MKINLNTAIRALNGQPMVDQNNIPVTCGVVVREALMAVLESDKGASADNKIKRTELARESFLNKVVDWQAEDIAMVKERINAHYENPLIVEFAFSILETPVTQEQDTETENE